MNASQPLPVDLTTSFAQRVDGQLRVVLGLPDRAAGDASVRLDSRKDSVTVPATAVPHGLEVRIPQDDLRPGLWTLSLSEPSGEVLPLEARLLANRKQPVALLPGPTPTTRMKAPQPSASTPAAGSAPAASGARPKVRRAAATTVDKALSVLPEERAAKTRAALAKVGRRVLG